jgi:iron complex transport system ATP-binding protein
MYKLHDVTFFYNEQQILKPLSFEIPKGSFFTIVGPNGSGKTTLLRLLSSYLQPAAGSIKLHRKPIQGYTRRARAREIAVVSQSAQINPHFTVKSLVELGREPYRGWFGRLAEKDHTIIEKTLTELEITEFKDRKLKSLSGGELQRVFIAKALVQQTPIVILDEPVNHLDIHHQVAILQKLKKMQRAGTTIIAVLHDLNFALRFSTHLLVLDRGLVALGKPHETLTPEILETVFHTDAYAFTKDLQLVLK